MKHRMIAANAGRNLAALAAFFAVLFVAARAGAALDAPAVQDTLELAATLIGWALALRLRAGIASLFLAGVGLMTEVVPRKKSCHADRTSARPRESHEC